MSWNVIENIFGIDIEYTGATRLETSNPYWVKVVNETSGDNKYSNRLVQSLFGVCFFVALAFGFA